MAKLVWMVIIATSIWVLRDSQSIRRAERPSARPDAWYIDRLGLDRPQARELQEALQEAGTLADARALLGALRGTAVAGLTLA